MGMLKRILRETSSKILHKLGAKPGSRRSMVLANAEGLASSHPLGVGGNSGLTGSKGYQSKKRRRASKNRASDSAALLMAAKNHLPPVQFHHVHGPNAVLSKNKCVARRTQSFCHALVFSNRIILPNERVYIKVLDIAKGWSGTIRFGFTSVDPATLRCQMPKHACPDMTNAGHTWARALADEVVRRNSVIHFSYNTAGYIHYGINNQDCGVFYANVNTSQHLWFIVDIYGLTAAVELIDPRRMNTPSGGNGLVTGSSSSELDLSSRLMDEQENIYGADGSTMFKSTSAMDQFGINSTSVARTKRKRSRKANRLSAPTDDALIYGDEWAPGSNNILMGSQMMTLAAAGRNHQVQTRPMLPNLSSIILPATQQNIYTPMPSLSRPAPPVPVVARINDAHDYYQIMTQTGRRGQAAAAATTANYAYATRGASTLNSSHASNRALSDDDDDAEEATGAEEMISNQLNSFQITTADAETQQQHQQQQSAGSKPTKSTTMPVAAVRRRLQNNNPVQTNSKREVNLKRDTANMRTINSTSASAALITTNNPKSSKASNYAANVKPKARHSSKINKTPSIRDNNNNSPPTKDCPICFERPINCVLYQCGHMCTCYECGVKQWRTQSKTCPICRTIIKDVIKTYMS